MHFLTNEALIHVRLHPINTIKPRKKTVNHPFKQDKTKQAAHIDSHFTSCLQKVSICSLPLWKARRMMLVTGPNLCEEDTARQTFTTALFLSSPGPHAVLMVLNLEDQQSQQCDIEKRAQELLGAEVLQYCIVLLLQNHQEPFTGASRGIAGEMINACGGRFHIIRDSEPKPAQRAALIAEIDKLFQLNDHRFYSVLRQELETEKLKLLQRLQEIEN